MPHAFFGLTTAGILALCAFGLLPPDQFVDVAKWVTILYALSTTVVAVVRHIWSRPGAAPTDAPTFDSRAYFDAETPDVAPQWPMGVESLGPFGTLDGDIFADALGDNLPPNYTSMVRDYGAPPTTTEGADGSVVTVPIDGAMTCVVADDGRSVVPPIDFDGVYGPKPPVPHDYNRRSPITIPVNRGLAEKIAARAAAASTATPTPTSEVVLGDPSETE